MDSTVSLSGAGTPAEPTDRRPRWLRRFLPMSYATAVPLTGEQMARLHLAAYH